MFIVFDLDDTLSDSTHREHIHDEEHESAEAKWDAFFEACDKDLVCWPIAKLLDSLLSGNKVEIWTGRSEKVRAKTERWMRKCLWGWDKIHALRMRAEGDVRPDTEVKAGWIREHGKPDLVFDDRNKVVKWWREQGVTCCQVKETDY